MIKYVIGENEFTEKDLAKKNKADLIELLKELGVTFDSGITNKAMVELIKQSATNFEDVVIEDIKRTDIDEETKSGASKKSLENRAAQILSQATKINEELQNASPTDRENLIVALAEKGGISVDTIRELFPTIDQADEVPIADDLPASDIITNLPLRVVEQQILAIIIETYPLVKLVNRQTVQNGIKDFFYQDYRDMDNKSGFDDVTIGDYNAGSEPNFKQTEKVDTELHKGYDILDSVLNDVTVTPGLWMALINNVSMAIARPLAKKWYERFVTYLSDVANFDEVIEFTSGDTKERSKQLYTHLTSIATPSRTNLKKKPIGSALALEKAIQAKNLTIVMDVKFSADYNYDLAAMTFQLGSVTFKVKEIIILDFAKVQEYVTGTNKFTDQNLILIEDGVYGELVHYEASKKVDTPKLKSVFHKYIRVGNYRTPDKYLGGFKPKTA